MYAALFQTLLRRLDPERAHHLAFPVLQAAGIPAQLRLPDALTPLRPDPSLRTTVFGVDFPSPFGLGAGFDKDARAILGLGALGFGHVEVGTLTRHAQPGNPTPRLFRLPEDRGLINRMGFNNGGSGPARRRIERARTVPGRPVIGANIGKSRITPVEDAIADYRWSAQRLAPVADYLAVNVSSPNTPGLRGLQELDMLEPLLRAVSDAAGETPVLVKIAPDLDDPQIEGIVELTARLGLAGIIATNTTISREGLSISAARAEEIGPGGLSGAPLKARSLAVLRRVLDAAPTGLTVVSVGGVTTAEDVLERLEMGAHLVQGYSAFIYEGPAWAHHINQGLVNAGWRGTGG